LDRLYVRYHRVEFLGSDPLEFPHRYRDFLDQEAVALLSALLAYGNVKQIRRSVETALLLMGRSPQVFVRSLAEPAGLARALTALSPFVHRFNRGVDVVVLFALLSKSWRKHGSLGAHFAVFNLPSAPDITDALNGLIGEWRQWIQDDEALKRLVEESPSFHYFLTSPNDGSCCKRWCMFLRWMGRREAGSSEGQLDLGLWAERGALRASQLVIPLDTHTGRISQYLGLTRRKSLNWLAALEVTESLKKCDGSDPTKYDFALARLGILNLCRRAYRSEICTQCDLLEGCRFARAGRARVKAREARKARKIAIF
jgi:uncharacterized protein (TIGR02757 family)